MQQYMIKTNQIINNLIELDEDVLHHIFKVMRMKINDVIECVDYQKQVRYACFINEDKMIEIKHIVDSNHELQHQLILVYSLVSSDKFELVIQKACELGVSKMIPLITSRTLVKIDHKLDKKLIRWQKIIKEACEQAKRDTIMSITLPCHINDLINEQSSLKFIAYEETNSQNKLDNFFINNHDCLLVIGPEGGFSLEEITLFKEMDFICISLGQRILRTETAAIVGCGILMNMMD
jgi:16S rRNA (uracil1498-N3)-methyltransferase